MSRIIDILNAIKSGQPYTENTLSRAEAILKSIANNTPYTGAAIGRYEELLLAVKNGTPTDMIPRTRIDELLCAIANGTLDDWVVGKNLLETNNLYVDREESVVIFNTEINKTVTFSYDFSDIVIDGTAMFGFRKIDDSFQYLSPYYKRLTLDNVKGIIVLNWGAKIGTLFNMKLEIGSTATPYTPYAFQSVLEEKLYEALGG